MAKTVCGLCGYKAHMEAITSIQVTPLLMPGGDEVVLEAAYKCANCGRLNVVSETHTKSGAKYVDITLVGAKKHDWGNFSKWSPVRTEWGNFPDVPDHIAQAASEAVACLSMQAYRGAGSLARAVVEATAKDKGASGRDLYDRIESLCDDGHIRPFAKEQAHAVRLFGNSMAHGDFVYPTEPEEAELAIGLMAAILDEVYQAPAKVLRLRDANEARKNQS